jgi:hypothetical protein
MPPQFFSKYRKQLTKSLSLNKAANFSDRERRREASRYYGDLFLISKAEGRKRLKKHIIQNTGLGAG